MSWTASAFLDEMQNRFQAWDGLAGVDVHTAAVDKLKKQDNIVFIRVDGDQEFRVIGGQSKDDSYTVESSVLVVKRGSGEAIAKEVRERAADILVEVENALRDIVQTNALKDIATAIGAVQINRLNLARFILNQGSNTDGRWAQVDFDIQVTARI